MRIVVAYKWTCDPEEATVRPDGTVDWSRAKPGLSAYDPVAIEVARQLADDTGAELIGVTVGGKGVATPLASQGRPRPGPGPGGDRRGRVPGRAPGDPSWPPCWPR